MTNCIVEFAGPPDDQGWRPVKCVRCGKVYRPTPDAPDNFRARCRAIADQPKTRASVLPCSRLGEAARQQECDSCAGKVQIKVFVCAIHGECTLGKKLEGLACCAGCQDYKP